MNTPIITRATLYSKLAAIFIATSIVTVNVKAEWSVDFSRRAKAIRETDLSDAAHGEWPTQANDSSNSSEVSTSSTTSRTPASVTAQTIDTTQMVSAKTAKEESRGVLDQVFEAGEPVQEIVILNTEKGFVPNTVRVRKNARYKISLVNVNEKEKNISFILDGFSEHHATYFGKVKTFTLEPKKEGVFSFESPETAAEGKLVVYNPPITVRNPASEK